MWIVVRAIRNITTTGTLCSGFHLPCISRDTSLVRYPLTVFSSFPSGLGIPLGPLPLHNPWFVAGSTRVALAMGRRNHYRNPDGLATPRLDEEVENELIRYASAARPLPDGQLGRPAEAPIAPIGWVRARHARA